MRRFRLQRLRGLTLVDRLSYEESIFRSPARNEAFFMLGDYHGGYGEDGHVAVLGRTNNPKEKLTPDALAGGVTAIRRFTGGGAVLFTPGCVFTASMIIPRKFLPAGAFSKWLLQFTVHLYRPIFPLNNFAVLQNDYVFQSPSGLMKIGGNAQSFNNDWAVHHTSFLWNADKEGMQKWLLNPVSQPPYRRHRNHDDFVMGLSEIDGFQSGKESFLLSVEDSAKRVFRKTLAAEIITAEDMSETACKEKTLATPLITGVIFSKLPVSGEVSFFQRVN